MTLDGDALPQGSKCQRIDGPFFWEFKSNVQLSNIRNPPPSPVEPASNHWRPLEKKSVGITAGVEPRQKQEVQPLSCRRSQMDRKTGNRRFYCTHAEPNKSDQSVLKMTHRSLVSPSRGLLSLNLFYWLFSKWTSETLFLFIVPCTLCT